MYEVRDRAGGAPGPQDPRRRRGGAAQAPRPPGPGGRGPDAPRSRNVVRLFDAGVDADRIYLLLELVDGRSLRDALALPSGRPPVTTLVRWIRQAAEGVAEAHRRGIIHRDLKPENLLITSQDVVKVIDFGIARLTGWGVHTTSGAEAGHRALHVARADPGQASGPAHGRVRAGAHPLRDPRRRAPRRPRAGERVPDLRSPARSPPAALAGGRPGDPVRGSPPSSIGPSRRIRSGASRHARVRRRAARGALPPRRGPLRRDARPDELPRAGGAARPTRRGHASR